MKTQLKKFVACGFLAWIPCIEVALAQLHLQDSGSIFSESSQSEETFLALSRRGGRDFVFSGGVNFGVREDGVVQLTAKEEVLREVTPFTSESPLFLAVSAIDQSPIMTTGKRWSIWNVLSNPVPESKNYAMLLAGLGLMAVIVFRRGTATVK